jgi:glycosyltransferase involved in cell wall biosynthesis
MACKKPVIGFNISSNPEIIDDTNTGYLVPAFDIDLLSKKVIQLAEDKGLKTRLGENGYLRVQNLFSINKTLSDLLKLEFIAECNPIE